MTELTDRWSEFLDWVNSDEKLKAWWPKVPNPEHEGWLDLRRAWRPTALKKFPVVSDFAFTPEKLVGVHPDPDTEWGKAWWDKHNAAQVGKDVANAVIDAKDEIMQLEFWKNVWNHADYLFPEIGFVMTRTGLKKKKPRNRWDATINGNRFCYWDDRPDEIDYQVGLHWKRMPIKDFIKGCNVLSSIMREDPIKRIREVFAEHGIS